MTLKNFLALTTCFLLASSLSAAEVVELFDGKTLDGWTRYGGEHEYSVRDGLIIGKVVEGEASSYLCTDREFGDFELTFEVKYLVGGVNSGCQLRSRIRKEDSEKNFMKKGTISARTTIPGTSTVRGLAPTTSSLRKRASNRFAQPSGIG